MLQELIRTVFLNVLIFGVVDLGQAGFTASVDALFCQDWVTGVWSKPWAFWTKPLLLVSLKGLLHQLKQKVRVEVFLDVN